MKTLICKTIAIGTAFLALETISHAELPSTITTTDGATYNGVSLIRVEPDGYLVNYQPVRNGIGVAKIKFSRLSADEQKQSGYDPQKAHEFELANAKGAENWREETARTEQAAKIAMQSRAQEDEREEQLNIQRLTATAQLVQAEANLAQAKGETPNDQNYGWSSYGDGIGLVALPNLNDRHRDNDREGNHDGHQNFNHDHSDNHQVLSPWPPRGNFNRALPSGKK